MLALAHKPIPSAATARVSLRADLTAHFTITSAIMATRTLKIGPLVPVLSIPVLFLKSVLSLEPIDARAFDSPSRAETLPHLRDIGIALGLGVVECELKSGSILGIVLGESVKTIRFGLLSLVRNVSHVGVVAGWEFFPMVVEDLLLLGTSDLVITVGAGTLYDADLARLEIHVAVLGAKLLFELLLGVLEKVFDESCVDGL